MLVQSHVAFPNWINRCCRLARSWATGLIKIIVSSAYMLVLSFTGSAPIGVSSPYWVASSSNRCRVSIASMNNIGETGSP
jgi:hypothetical protein